MLENVDYREVRFWFDVLQTLGLFIVTFYIWLTNRHKANSGAIRKLDNEIRTKINAIEDSLIAMDKDIEHLPKNTDVARIHQRIDDVAQGLTRMQGSQDAGNRTLALIQQHLIGKG
jgi:hypothetical protein